LSDLSNRTDADLMAAVARGDQSALAELYDRLSPVLFGVAMRLLRDRAEAEDLLHDLFMEALYKAHSYDRGKGTVRTWLMVRLRSRAIDRLRTHSRSRQVDDPEPVLAALVGSGTGDPALAPDRRAVRAALSRLPPEQQQVLELAYFSGLSASEIAKQLSLPAGTVKSRLGAGVRKLRVHFLASSGGPT